MRHRISPNTPVSETSARTEGVEVAHEVLKLDDFVTQKSEAKSPLQALIRHIIREANRQKLNYGHLKYVFRVVRQRCEIEVSGGKARRLFELPTAADLDAFYAAITDPIHRLIFEVLESTGLRVSELCRLEVHQIDFKTNLIFVSQGKGGKDRVTVIGNRVLEKLMIYLAGRQNRYLFESGRHTRFSSRRIEQLCKTYRERSGVIKKLTPHVFRHVWNTRLAEAGLPEDKRAILAGHSDTATQAIYTHLSAGGVKDEVIAILDKQPPRRLHG